MEDLIKKRRVVRAGFTRSFNSLEKTFKENTGNINDPTVIRSIQALFEQLEKRYNDLNELDLSILDSMIAEKYEDEKVEEDVVHSEQYESNFLQMKAVVSSILKEESERSFSTVVNNNQTNKKYRLPKVELKKFNGDPKSWLTFWSLFQNIDSDPSLTNEEKFQYLLQSAIPGSRAHDVVASFPPTAENYTKTIEELKNRFGREGMLVEVYTRELLKLVLQNAVSTTNCRLSEFYDKLECQLRALETLGVTSEKCASVLFPLVESCLPEELLRAWQRSTFNTTGSFDGPEAEVLLSQLRKFLKKEVENEERITLAKSGFGFANQGKKKGVPPTSSGEDREIPSASSLLSVGRDSGTKNVCIFCLGQSHKSPECLKAQDLSLEEKRKIIKDKNACFICLRSNHIAQKCKATVKCNVCRRRHTVLMCPEVRNAEVDEGAKSIKDLSNITSQAEVYLQTIVLVLKNKNKERKVRALIDTGSMRSYILRDTAWSMGYSPVGGELISHSVFGGDTTKPVHHQTYKISVSSLDKKGDLYRFDALEQKVICGKVSSIKKGPWIQEFEMENIQLSDYGQKATPIEILLGADVAGRLLTGKKIELPCGLVALETCLGWTVMGKIKHISDDQSCVSTLISLHVSDNDLSELWRLETIGITEPSEKKSQAELHQTALKHFTETVTVNNEGRYEVHLPWIEGHNPLPTNYDIAFKRLQNAVCKMKTGGIYDDYQHVFEEWLSDGVIEEVPIDQRNCGKHYLPHRAVIKEGSTTRIRPVFDASAHEKMKPSINDCLEKGVNLIEQIPSLLLRFRMRKFGITGDIKRAFSQISLAERDRDFLRFLWQDSSGILNIYRHCRVVFGVICSPFLLGAVIIHHLQQYRSRYPEKACIIDTLLNSFYVDNCVVSVNSQDETDHFIQEATSILGEAKMELRGWEFTGQKSDNDRTKILGLEWDKDEDSLQLCSSCFDFNLEEKVTKRNMLSIAHKLFDPVGFICPVALFPKRLLQKTWEQGIGWDQEASDGLKREFLNWAKELPLLRKVKIPRWLTGSTCTKKMTLHTFCDASQYAYAAAVFIRVETDEGVLVQLIQAKARVAPMKRTTIPRLELLAATIGVRLHQMVFDSWTWEGAESFFWSDSSTTLAWIKRDDRWAPFVGNRVREIRESTHPLQWRYVPGPYNPADLPSRGCGARKLLESRWWEGPDWLRDAEDHWPLENVFCDEEQVTQERRKVVTSSVCLNSSSGLSTDWYYRYFSQYRKLVRFVAWISRTINKCKKIENPSTHLTNAEIALAEKRVMKWVQEEAFSGKQRSKELLTLNSYRDTDGIIRIRTKVSNREDSLEFRYPIVLPADHPVVTRLIVQTHEDHCHVGVQGLMSILRERFWILQTRRAIRAVLNKCVICRRYNAKKMETIAPSLPIDRVRDAGVFEVCGIDFAGPVYLKGSSKAWICLYTCATVRAIHLELVTSMSTELFILSFRRFIGRRGRPYVVFTDNGTNFVGAMNALAQLEWDRITEVTQIDWKFSPPTAPWWGGWWERLIAVVKQLLKKTLKRTSLDYEEMSTVLCDIEAIVNSRPLTYVSEDSKDLAAITPSLFLQDLKDIGVPDLDLIDSLNLQKRAQYRMKLRDELRQRFRIEYLGMLESRNSKRQTRGPAVGELVLVGSDNQKRMDWPMARVRELLPSKDGQTRVVRLLTASGELLRPIQRIYPLEIQEEKNLDEQPRISRSGRKIVKPSRYDPR